MLKGIGNAYRSAFAGLPREAWILAGATLVNRAGTMVLPFMSLYLTRSLGFSTAEAGRVLGLYGIGAVAGAYLGGWLSDRVGAIRVQQVSLLATGAGFLALSQAHSRVALSLTVLLVAVISECFRPALFASVVQVTTPAVRTRSLALLRMAVNLGMSAGPAVGGFLAVHDWTLLFVADALTCWAAAVVLFLTLRHVGRGTVERSADPAAAAATPWRDRPYLLFLVLMTAFGTVFFQLMGTLQLYLRDAYHLPENAIGLLLGLNAMIIVAAEMIVVRHVEHLDPLRVLAVGCLLVCFGFFLMPFGTSVAWAVVTILFWTLGEMLSLPMANAIASHRGPAAAGGRFIGAYSLAFSLAFVIGPVTGTAVYQRFGGDVLWLAIGPIGLGLFAGCMALSRRFVPGQVLRARRVE